VWERLSGENSALHRKVLERPEGDSFRATIEEGWNRSFRTSQMSGRRCSIPKEKVWTAN